MKFAFQIILAVHLSVLCVFALPAKNPDNYVTFHVNQPYLTFYGPERDSELVRGVVLGGGTHGGNSGGVQTSGSSKDQQIHQQNSLDGKANNDYKFDGDVYYVDSPFWENELKHTPPEPPKDAARYNKNIVMHTFFGKK